MRRVIIHGGTGGLATAHALRNRGHALHLVARHPARLTRAADDLRSASAPDTDRVAAATQAVGRDLAGLVDAVDPINLRTKG